MGRIAFILALAASASACAEPAPAPVDGEIIERAVKHAQDQTDDARRRRNASRSAIIESNG